MSPCRLTDWADARAGIDRWNDRHPEFAIDDRLVAQNVYAPFDGLTVAAWGSYAGDDLVGFALGKTLTRAIPNYAGPERGWISLLAVDSGAGDPRGVAADLLETAEADLAATGVETIRFGGDPQNFLTGLPTDLVDDYRPHLTDADFERERTVYDLASDISGFEPPESVEAVRANEDDLAVERVAPDHAADLLAFLADQFPGRWRYEAENIDRIPGGIADYWVLRHAGSVVGFARTNAPESAYRGPNANWGWRLGDDYCGLGPLGVHEDCRGRRWGLFMLSRIIETLRDEGVEHVVIDWTTLLDYYGRLGFEPWIEYEVFVKEV